MFSNELQKYSHLTIQYASLSANSPTPTTPFSVIYKRHQTHRFAPATHIDFQ